MLLPPNTLRNPPLLSLPQYFLSRCHPVHTLASPGVGRDPHCSSQYTRHTHSRTVYCPIILSLCHFSAVFLPPTFQIPHPQKCDQLFSHPPPTHLALQYTLPTTLGLLAPSHPCILLLSLAFSRIYYLLTLAIFHDAVSPLPYILPPAPFPAIITPHPAPICKYPR
jgi:hypothetical protein